MWADYRVWFFNTQERDTVDTSTKKSISNNFLDLRLFGKQAYFSKNYYLIANWNNMCYNIY